jgi:hypothetical protein
LRREKGEAYVVVRGQVRAERVEMGKRAVKLHLELDERFPVGGEVVKDGA